VVNKYYLGGGGAPANASVWIEFGFDAPVEIAEIMIKQGSYDATTMVRAIDWLVSNDGEKYSYVGTTAFDKWTLDWQNPVYVEQTRALPSTVLGLGLPSGSTPSVEFPSQMDVTVTAPVQIDDTNPVKVAVQPTTSVWIDRSGVIATGGTAQTVAAALANRHGFWLQNISDEPLWLSDVGTAGPDASSMMIPAGALYEMPAQGVTAAALSIWGATAGQRFVAREWGFS
jgi:hypothetical protein